MTKRTKGTQETKKTLEIKGSERALETKRTANVVYGVRFVFNVLFVSGNFLKILFAKNKLFQNSVDCQSIEIDRIRIKLIFRKFPSTSFCPISYESLVSLMSLEASSLKIEIINPNTLTPKLNLYVYCQKNKH
jgi:hypothetical protein